jgi:monofunctional biosynthetic peptidoglycan transglycosylase
MRRWRLFGRTRRRSRPARWTRAAKRRALRLGAVALTGFVAVTGALTIWWWWPPGDLDAWRAGPPSGSWATRDRQLARREAAGESRALQFAYRPLDQIPIDLQLAVLVGEDINFFSHGGIDFGAVGEAVDEWRAGERLRGASTISQQLAKNLYLTTDRSWLRKAREAKLTWWLERELGKRRILELYLNVIEFDEGVLGVEAAARRYYGKSCAGLTAAEAAGLAAAIPAPRTATPATATRAWQTRRSVIQGRMARADWLRRLLQSTAG